MMLMRCRKRKYLAPVLVKPPKTSKQKCPRNSALHPANSCRTRVRALAPNNKRAQPPRQAKEAQESLNVYAVQL